MHGLPMYRVSGIFMQLAVTALPDGDMTSSLPSVSNSICMDYMYEHL